ncbi:MAG TPA: FecR domain-containing protein [Verrucomicrobiae bacterium]
MKKIQTLLAAIMCGLVLGIAIKTSAQTGQAGFATAVRVEGIVSYSLGDGQWQPLVAGKILPVGAIVRTGNNGATDLVLGKDIQLPLYAQQVSGQPDHPALPQDAKVRGMASFAPAMEQNVVRLTPDTTLAINKLNVIDTGSDTVSDTELDLQKGKIFASVKKLNGASTYYIKLPSGIAGVRGTQFSVDVGGAVSVSHSTGGGVVLTLTPPGGGAPQTTVVGVGYSYNPATGALTLASSDVITMMQNLFNALQTIYSPVNFFISRDGTQCYVSPTHGATGGHHHSQSGGQPED